MWHLPQRLKLRELVLVLLVNVRLVLRLKARHLRTESVLNPIKAIRELSSPKPICDSVH